MSGLASSFYEFVCYILNFLPYISSSLACVLTTSTYNSTIGRAQNQRLLLMRLLTPEDVNGKVLRSGVFSNKGELQAHYLNSIASQTIVGSLTLLLDFLDVRGRVLANVILSVDGAIRAVNAGVVAVAEGGEPSIPRHVD